MSPPICMVRGSGDIGSAVAHQLFRQGFAVAIHDVPAPAYPRRGMAFTDALFDGHALLDGVTARHAPDLEALVTLARGGRVIAVFGGGLEAAIDALGADVLVDARMRKREAPETQLGMAALTIGLGPGFVAGRTVDLAVETAWGEMLGEVIGHGSTLPLAGEPRAILGHSRARFVYAFAAGTIESAHHIGDSVAAGDEVARLAGRPLLAPFAGIVAGLTRPGVAVREGAKVIEVDPRGKRALAFGMGERGRRIGSGVLRAVATAFASTRRLAAASSRRDPVLHAVPSPERRLER